MRTPNDRKPHGKALKQFTPKTGLNTICVGLKRKGILVGPSGPGSRSRSAKKLKKPRRFMSAGPARFGGKATALGLVSPGPDLAKRLLSAFAESSLDAAAAADAMTDDSQGMAGQAQGGNGPSSVPCISIAIVRPALEGRGETAGSNLEVLEGERAINVRGRAGNGFGTQYNFTRSVAAVPSAPEAWLEPLYIEELRESIAGCWGGLTAVIMAAGQTGSGKTYAMGTAAKSTHEGTGVVQLSLATLWAAALPGDLIEMSGVEIIDDKFYDLLGSTTRPVALESQAGPRSGRPRYSLEGQVWRPVASLEESGSALAQITLARATSDNGFHASSSRSHLIVLVRTSRKVDDGLGSGSEAQGSDGLGPHEARYKVGHVVLMDLAGSEKPGRENRPDRPAVVVPFYLATPGGIGSGAHGHGPSTPRSPLPGHAAVATGGMAEGIAINESLSYLAAYVRARAKGGKQVDVAMRQHKLLYFIDSLLDSGGKLAVLACLSPSDDHIFESRRTLEFAALVKNLTVRPVPRTEPRLVTPPGPVEPEAVAPRPASSAGGTGAGTPMRGTVPGYPIRPRTAEAGGLNVYLVGLESDSGATDNEPRTGAAEDVVIGCPVGPGHPGPMVGSRREGGQGRARAGRAGTGLEGGSVASVGNIAPGLSRGQAQGAAPGPQAVDAEEHQALVSRVSSLESALIAATTRLNESNAKAALLESQLMDEKERREAAEAALANAQRRACPAPPPAQARPQTQPQPLSALNNRSPSARSPGRATVAKPVGVAMVEGGAALHTIESELLHLRDDLSNQEQEAERVAAKAAAWRLSLGLSASEMVSKRAALGEQARVARGKAGIVSPPPSSRAAGPGVMGSPIPAAQLVKPEAGSGQGIRSSAEFTFGQGQGAERSERGIVSPLPLAAGRSPSGRPGQPIRSPARG